MTDNIADVIVDVDSVVVVETVGPKGVAFSFDKILLKFSNPSISFFDICLHALFFVPSHLLAVAHTRTHSHARTTACLIPHTHIHTLAQQQLSVF